MHSCLPKASRPTCHSALQAAESLPPHPLSHSPTLLSLYTCRLLIVISVMAFSKHQREDDDAAAAAATAATDASDLPTKKRKTHRPPDNFSPEFYDSLSKVFLTRRALRELDRRNGIGAPTISGSSPTRHREPLTRGAYREPQRKDSTATRLLDPGIETIVAREVAKFARHGGPDLSDIRGVSLTLRTHSSRITS